MTSPLDDEGLDRLLGQFHRDLLHQWTTTFSSPGPQPALYGWSQDLKARMDPLNTDGLNIHRFLQATIANLLLEITAHLGTEGEIILDRASFHLSRLLGGLEQQELDSERALALTAALANGEAHLRDMVDFDFAPSTCSRTHEALDQLNASICHLNYVVRNRFDRVHTHSAQH